MFYSLPVAGWDHLGTLTNCTWAFYSHFIVRAAFRVFRHLYCTEKLLGRLSQARHRRRRRLGSNPHALWSRAGTPRPLGHNAALPSYHIQSSIKIWHFPNELQHYYEDICAETMLIKSRQFPTGPLPLTQCTIRMHREREVAFISFLFKWSRLKSSRMLISEPTTSPRRLLPCIRACSASCA